LCWLGCIISVLLAFLGFLSVALGAVSKPSTYRPAFKAHFFARISKKIIYAVITHSCIINGPDFSCPLGFLIKMAIYSIYTVFYLKNLKVFSKIFMDWLFIQIFNESIELSHRDRTALVPVHVKIVTGSMTYQPVCPLA
jgi:hypothetical protein